MSRIWKYTFQVSDELDWLSLPKGAKFRHAACQVELVISMWFEINKNEPIEQRLFCVVGTGQIVPDGGNYKWLCTIMDGDFVWHLFERIKL